MNYRHAYHAGNFADVHKHAVLGRVLAHLRLKPAAFRVIDTHAGAGRYDLSGPEPARPAQPQAVPAPSGEALAFPNGCVSADGRNDARRLPSPASTLAPSPSIPLRYPTP